MEQLLFKHEIKLTIMKNLLLLFGLFAAIVLTSCKGEPGPPGPQGPQGGLAYAKVFEAKVNSYQYDVNANQLFSSFYSFPFTVYESDVVLGYHYEGQQDIGNGEVADVWTMLPQNVFYNDGTGDFFQYNFNHTFIDVQFTIEGNFPLTEIHQDHATNQLFRIAVVPAEFARTNPSMSDIMEVMNNDDSFFIRIEN